ncbi:copper amine oxidase N-terminal domain-containing protein [Paenibacillus sp. 7124]|uniref:Copper amine oxidase N-terminal domain-containing protein n=1 Tax=Paenibacillus apii TaxID=1850370 RepID=A0A6M1PKJ9_9BACL|nr:copper amine oxidase N-terminal domain-containing protein [Paenibacillus apii]NGM82832.1 copper amine oxidase N-terminal domain-containing protein [Paenibacillus apii]NJJ39972.1 copper amine oxidase N-terminal domain-containing protein [Paenibacillus apii]
MKRFNTLLAVFLIITLFSAPFTASAATLPLRVVVDGKKVNFPDAQPFIDAQQRVQLPVRFVTEALGAKVLWDGPAKKATIILNGKTMVVYIGKTSYTVDGKTKQMDTAALFKESRTFVPLRFLYEGLGVNVNWDDSVKTVYITTGGSGGTTTAPSTGTKTADVYGFKVNYVEMGPNLEPAYVSASGMTVYENDDPEPGKVLFQLTIVFSEAGSDPVQGAKDAESILRQKIEDNVVDSIMKYARTKTKISDILPLKEFTSKNYNFMVLSSEYDDIAIMVIPK